MKYINNIIFLLPLLGGCGLIKPSPPQPLDVEIPVAVPCGVTEVAEPEWNIPRLPGGADAESELKAELADLELARGYIGELKAELKGCE